MCDSYSKRKKARERRAELRALAKAQESLPRELPLDQPLCPEVLGEFIGTAPGPAADLGEVAALVAPASVEAGARHFRNRAGRQALLDAAAVQASWAVLVPPVLGLCLCCPVMCISSTCLAMELDRQELVVTEYGFELRREPRLTCFPGERLRTTVIDFADITDVFHYNPVPSHCRRLCPDARNLRIASKRTGKAILLSRGMDQKAIMRIIKEHEDAPRRPEADDELGEADKKD